MTNSRIGFATMQAITDKVFFEGKFLPNEKAQGLKNDMKAGMPMEASLYIPPMIIEQVMKGQNAQVNGFTLEGPGTVFRKSQIKEVSICVFGADNNTISKVFADGEISIIVHGENSGFYLLEIRGSPGQVFFFAIGLDDLANEDLIEPTSVEDIGDPAFQVEGTGCDHWGVAQLSIKDFEETRFINLGP
jgi:hypothetical protein